MPDSRMGKLQTLVDVGEPTRILLVSVVTPEATLLEMPAQFVALPLYDGELGVAPGHSPFIGRLGYGELRVGEGGKSTRYFIGGGFVQVSKNVVSILTNSATPADRLDADAARDELATARARQAHTPELWAIRERAQLQARAKIRVADKQRHR
jgi:F-type H+-transporting ATPase subunit epsilon